MMGILKRNGACFVLFFFLFFFGGGGVKEKSVYFI